MLAVALLLALVLDPAPQLLDIRVHPEELVSGTCLCVVHLKTRALGSDARQRRRCLSASEARYTALKTTLDCCQRCGRRGLPVTTTCGHGACAWCMCWMHVTGDAQGACDRCM